MAKPEPSPDERLARALSEAKSQLARPDEVARLWHATQARVAATSATPAAPESLAPPGTPAAPGATTIGWTASKGWLALGAIALFAGLGALHGSATDREVRLTAPRATPGPHRAEAPSPAPRFEQLPRERSRAQRAPSTNSRPKARAVKRAAAKLPQAQRHAGDELALIEQADALLFADPRRALVLLEKHATAFPAGALAQERELMLITALMDLGRADAAKGRAERFLSAYPSSPHRRRVARLIEKKGRQPDNAAPDSLPTQQSNKAGGTEP